MNILEKEIEDIIWDCIEQNRALLKDRGLHIVYDRWKYFRQVNLGSYGIADMVAIKMSSYGIYCTIYELKKDTIDIYTLLQAARYAKGIRRILGDNKRVLDFSFCLIGKQLNTGSDFCYLIDALPDVSIYTYTIDLVNGIRFHRQYGFKQVTESLPKLNFSISDIKEMF